MAAQGVFRGLRIRASCSRLSRNSFETLGHVKHRSSKRCCTVWLNCSGGNRGARRWHRPHRVSRTAWATNTQTAERGARRCVEAGDTLGVSFMNRYICYLLIGSPGAGKGTQGKILGTIPRFFHCACGDVFRALDLRTPLGRQFA